jgi:hypothetical protein
MGLPFLLRNRHRRTRGQAMVEFAILLPVLALLMVMSLDLGRVFFGWVGLQNVSRVAANYAAVNPEGWDPNTQADVKQDALDQYAQHVAREAAGLNCSPLPITSPAATYIPIPSFDDLNGNGSYDLGERVSVTLGCSFELITPLANNAVGGGVHLTANSVFPVRGGGITGGPIPVPSASASASASATATATATATASATASACALPTANFVASTTHGKKPLDVYFQDTSQTFGCAITGWEWDFDYKDDDGDGLLDFTVDSTLPNPHKKYTHTGQYVVRLRVSDPGGGTDSFTGPGYIDVCDFPC